MPVEPTKDIERALINFYIHITTYLTIYSCLLSDYVYNLIKTKIHPVLNLLFKFIAYFSMILLGFGGMPEGEIVEEIHLNEWRFMFKDGMLR
jgi:hypothetical protein